MGSFDLSKPVVEEVPATNILSYIEKNLINTRYELGFRGQQSAGWQLRPTLARFLEELKAEDKIDEKTTYEDIQSKIIREFRESILLNQDLTPEQLEHVDLWQYGQHYGLPTPLLDWTYSPYVGLFFALSGKGVADAKGQPAARSIWVINIDLLHQINSRIIHEISVRSRLIVYTFSE